MSVSRAIVIVLTGRDEDTVREASLTYVLAQKLRAGDYAEMEHPAAMWDSGSGKKLLGLIRCEP